jgi:hypothetical protein
LDDMMLRVMRLASQGLYCSQIIMALALETRGEENRQLIRSLGGLAFGCGDGRGTCGVLTGASCVLGLYAGKAGPEEEEAPDLPVMQEQLADWFAGEAGVGITCEAIMGETGSRAPKQKCGELVAAAFGRVLEILMENGIDPAGGDGLDEY